MDLTQVNTSSHLGQSYHVGRNTSIAQKSFSRPITKGLLMHTATARRTFSVYISHRRPWLAAAVRSNNEKKFSRFVHM